MGKIEDMQQKQNNENGVNLSYARNQAKPRFGIKGIKDIALLYKPGIEKEYDFYPEEKKFIRILRAGTLTIAGLAAVSSVFIGSRHLVTSQNSNTVISADATNELLDKDTVLLNATNKLQECIYSSPSLYKDIKVDYDKDDELGYYSVSFQHQYNSSSDYHEGYRYMNTNNKNNDDNINQIFNQILKIKNSKNPSQKELQELETMMDELDTKSFHIVCGNLVRNTEKELQDER